jgi:hypothetical protein
MKKKVLSLMLLIMILAALSEYWYVAAVGAGAAVTYYAVEKGYKVQSQVTHETPKTQQDKG